MPDFKPINLGDRTRYLSALHGAEAESCEYCFGNIYAWSDIYPTYIAYEDKCVYLQQTDGERTLWPMPIAEDEQAFARAIRIMDGIQLHRDGTHAHFVYINEAQRQRLDRLFPGAFEFHNHDEYDEYLYEADNFRTYSGKKLHAKRNHYNSFIKTYGGRWAYEKLERSNAAECAEFAADWGAKHASEKGIGTDKEEHVLDVMLSCADQLGLLGGVLRVDGRICGFTIAERCACHPQTAVIHIENADDEVRGAYPTLASMFAQDNPDFIYINREEDMGIPGLRQSKSSYCPCRMIKKYSCRAGRPL